MPHGSAIAVTSDCGDAYDSNVLGARKTWENLPLKVTIGAIFHRSPAWADVLSPNGLNREYRTPGLTSNSRVPATFLCRGTRASA